MDSFKDCEESSYGISMLPMLRKDDLIRNSHPLICQEEFVKSPLQTPSFLSQKSHVPETKIDATEINKKIFEAFEGAQIVPKQSSALKDVQSSSSSEADQSLEDQIFGNFTTENESFKMMDNSELENLKMMIASKYRHKFINLKQGEKVPDTIDVENAIFESIQSKHIHMELQP